MADSLALWLAFHDGKVRHALAGARASACELFAIEIHKAHVLRFHESFANESRGAEHQVVSDADGHVAAITIGVIALPHAFAEIANTLFKSVDFRGVKKVEDFSWCLRIASWLPFELVIG